MKGPNNRATTAEVKDHMLSKGGRSVSHPTPKLTRSSTGRKTSRRILPGYVPPPRGGGRR